MFILDTVSHLCSDPGLANILAIVKKFMNILWIVGPILAIIATGINLTKLMTNPDEKKYKPLIKNSITALLFLFFIPIIVNTVMGLLDESFEFAACWNYAENVSTSGQSSGYIDQDGDKKPGSMLTDPSKFETGIQNNTGTSTNTTTNGSSGTSTSVGTKKVIFIGDSRTVGMKQSVGSNQDIWSCKSSMGLNWMKSTGVPNIDKQVTTGTAVVVLMGVNDLYQINNYITYMNSLADGVSKRGGQLYFVSVNPTSKSKDYLNEDIDNFNAKMRQGMSNKIRYIDTNSYLKNIGFSSGDGLHYSTKTYKDIYNYIKKNI